MLNNMPSGKPANNGQASCGHIAKTSYLLSVEIMNLMVKILEAPLTKINLLKPILEIKVK
jgi:hypothetical protein